MMGVAGPRGVTAHTYFAAVFGCGVAAIAGLRATATRHVARRPCGPAAVNNGTVLRVAGLCGVTARARLAPFFGLGVIAVAGASTTAARHGAVIIAPFRPVPIQQIAVVSQTAPALGARGGQAQRIDSSEIVFVERTITVA